MFRRRKSAENEPEIETEVDDVVDELGGVTYRWSGNRNFVDLAPWSASAHIFSVHPVSEQPTTDESITDQQETAT